MKRILLFFTVLSFGFVYAQGGNTINDATEIDGTSVAVVSFNYSNATASGLMPACGTTEDVFYYHQVSAGDNRLTIGMASASTSVITSIDYQILRAPQGDINNLEVVDCDAYPILLVVGGSFETVIDSVIPGDVYYLRVYKTSGLGGAFTNVINASNLTFVSTFDASLSTSEANKTQFKVFTKSNKLELFNNTNFKSYHVYSLDGKTALKGSSKSTLEHISIENLNKGLYVANFTGNNVNYYYKFVKH